MKKCPYCAEQIQDEAIVCRWCGRDLNQQATPEYEKQPDYFGMTEYVKKVTAHYYLVTYGYVTKNLVGRKFFLPNLCSRCGASPAQYSIDLEGKIGTVMTNYWLTIPVPICSTCYSKKRLKAKEFVHYSDGCRSLVFSNSSIQSWFDRLNIEMTSEATYQEFREAIKRV